MENYSFDVNNRLRRDEFGTYYKGHHKKTKKDVIIKKTALYDKEEFNLLKTICKPPIIIELLDHFEDTKFRWLVYGYHSLNDLGIYCRTNKPSLELTISIVTQVAIAVNYLHTLKRPVVHRDLKPENIFLENEGSEIRVKLGGFSLSKQAYKDITFDKWVLRGDYTGTMLYMAPEALSGNGYTTAVDVFSLGLVLECMVHYGQGVIGILYPGIATRPAEEQKEPIGRVMRQNYSLVKPVPNENEKYKKCKQLITRMTEYDPKLRPSMAEVLTQLHDLNVEECGRKENGDYFRLENGLTIPRSLGMFLHRNNPSLLKEALALRDDVLVTEMLKEHVQAVNVDIQVPAPENRCMELLNSEFIGELEAKFGVIIEYQEPRKQDEKEEGVFRDEHTKLEVEDKNHNFVMSYAVQDITAFRCDAIVNSTGTDINLSVGVLAKAIGDAGGQGLKDECKKHGKLQIGDVFVSGPGELKVKYVFHIASPRCISRGEELEVNQCLKAAVMKVLQQADDLQLRKIAIPAIGSGGFGFSMEVSLKSIFSAVKEYFEKRKLMNRNNIFREV